MRNSTGLQGPGGNAGSGSRRRLAAAGAVGAGFVAMALLALAVLTGCGAMRSDGPEEVGSAAGLTVYDDEVVMYAASIKASVSAEFCAEHGLSEVGGDFWTTSYDGETPLDELVERTLDEVVRAKVTQRECLERSITAPGDFLEMERAAQEEAETSTDGGATGASDEDLRYELSQYNGYLMTACEDDLKEVLLEDELAPTEEELEAAYMSLDETLRRAEFTASGWVWTWDDSSLDETARRSVADALATGTGPADVAAELAKEVPGIGGERFSFDSEKDVHREDSTAQERADALFPIEEGKLSNVFHANDSELYLVEDKSGGGYVPWEENPRLAESAYINEAYEKYLDNVVAQAEAQEEVLLDVNLARAAIEDSLAS